MQNYFGFMDETGVLANDVNQPFFALGLLKLENTAIFYEQIKVIRDEAVRMTSNKNFEFKFNSLTKGNILLYKKLICTCLTMKDFYFSTIIIDKNHPNFSTSIYKNTWEAQISLAKLLIKNNVQYGDIVIIADYLTKPKNSNKVFEVELKQLKKVHNACMLESDASLFIQVVDIFIGSIIYANKTKHKLIQTTNKAKKELSSYTEQQIQQDFSSNFTVNDPYYFSCWHFKPKKIMDIKKGSSSEPTPF